MKKNILAFLSIVLIFSLLTAISYNFKVNENRCVGCGDCTNICPVNAISLKNGKAVIDTEKCIKCDICKKTCNYEAIRKLK